MNKTEMATRSRGPWMQTLMGHKLHLLDPRPEEIDLLDIAGHLAKVPRFAGATLAHYSVAQHSLHVAELMPTEMWAYGLLHDAHEAYIGDMTTPVKVALRSMSKDGVDWYAIMAGRLDSAIHATFGLAWPPTAEVAEAVRRADLVMLSTERRDLLGDHVAWGMTLPEPLPEIIHADDDWRVSCSNFLVAANWCGLRPKAGRA